MMGCDIDAMTNASDWQPIWIPWLGGAILLIVWEIVISGFFRGYDVYRNKSGEKSSARTKFCIKYILIGKIINYAALIAAGVLSGLFLL